MKVILMTLMAVFFVQITARWTGRSEFVTTVTGRQAVRCEYQAPSIRSFWKTFSGVSCPPTVTVY